MVIDWERESDVDNGSESEEEITATVTPAKRRKSSFANISSDARRKRTNRLLQSLRDFAAEESDERLINDAKEFSVNQLLGYCLHRVNHQSNKKLAELGMNLFHGIDVTEKDYFSTSEAITLKHDLTLSKCDMRLMGKYLKTKMTQMKNFSEN